MLTFDPAIKRFHLSNSQAVEAAVIEAAEEAREVEVATEVSHSITES